MLVEYYLYNIMRVCVCVYVCVRVSAPSTVYSSHPRI